MIVPTALLFPLLLGQATLVASVGESKQSQERTLPITKVLKMMESMAAKGIKEKQEEKVKFAAFSQWCNDQTRIKNDEISAGEMKIEKLTAKIEKDSALINKLTDRIQELDADVARWAKDKQSATDVREKERTDYKATATDYAESLSALRNAIEVLKAQSKNTAQERDPNTSGPVASLVETALLQVSQLRRMDLSSKKALQEFLRLAQPDVAAMPAEELAVSAPEAYAYESQTGGVIDMLDKLENEFGSKARTLDKEEQIAEQAFEQLLQILTDKTENANHEIDKKKVLRAETEESKADAEGEKAQAEADKAEDEKYLAEMTALCELKQTDFQARQQLRGEEIDAIKKAIEIMGGDNVAGAGEKYLPTFVQVQRSSATALPQLRSGQTKGWLQEQIAKYLATRGSEINSKALSMLSDKISAAAGGPFDKVKKMIKELISTLMQEATAEAEHKGWCDTELGVNKQTRDSKTEAVEKLTDQQDDLSALIEKLTQEIEELTTAIAELDEAMSKATQTREENKATNEQTIQDAKQAQVATQQAMAILKDFYAKSAEATALSQQSPAEDAPETFDKPYKGMLGEGGSIVDFLEVILSDFVKLEADTAANEEAEANEYKKFMFESEKDKALKETQKRQKEEKRQSSDSALKRTTEELKLTQEALDDAVAYYEKLKPTCVESGINYEDRVKQREEEIQSLQEALKILQDQNIDLD